MNHHLGYSPVEDYGSEGEAKRILAMVARCAPRLMRAGGGPLEGDVPNRGQAVPEGIKASVVQLRTGSVLTVQAIAEVVGYSRATVENICRAAGIRRRPVMKKPAPRLTREQRCAVGERLRRGDPPKVVAAELGHSLSVVYKNKQRKN